MTHPGASYFKLPNFEMDEVSLLISAVEQALERLKKQTRRAAAMTPGYLRPFKMSDHRYSRKLCCALFIAIISPSG
jgi:hypothetical protein